MLPFNVCFPSSDACILFYSVSIFCQLDVRSSSTFDHVFFAFKIESLVCGINIFLNFDLFALYKEKICSTQAEE